MYTNGYLTVAVRIAKRLIAEQIHEAEIRRVPAGWPAAHLLQPTADHEPPPRSS